MTSSFSSPPTSTEFKGAKGVPIETPSFFNNSETPKTRNVVLRFLPSHPSEQRNFFSKKFYKIFHNGSSYAEHSLVDIRKADPVYEYYNALHSLLTAAVEENNKQEESRLREIIFTNRLYGPSGLRPFCDYFANVLVVDDKEMPDNNGFVYVLRFKKIIWNKIKELGAKNMNAFYMFEAPTFNYISRYNGKFIELKDCHFNTENLTPIAPTKEEIYNIIDNFTYKLSHLGLRKPYGEYSDLKNKFINVLGASYYTNLGLPVPDGCSFSSPSENALKFSKSILEQRRLQQK